MEKSSIIILEDLPQDTKTRFIDHLMEMERLHSKLNQSLSAIRLGPAIPNWACIWNKAHLIGTPGSVEAIYKNWCIVRINGEPHIYIELRTLTNQESWTE